MSTQPSAAPPAPAQQSPWQSPVPYLFGGLAAMLMLIALALSILAYSYWKLSGNFESQDDLETREREPDGGDAPEPAVAGEKYLVIMAGQEKPTFLATPMSSRASSFGSKRSGTSTSSTSENSLPIEEDYEEKSVNVHIDHMGSI